MKMKRAVVLGSLLLSLGLLLSGCLKPVSSTHRQPEKQVGLPAPITLSEDESLISILGTNDLHGAIQPKKVKPSKEAAEQRVGGMAFWAGAVKSIREGVAKRYGRRAGVLVVDGGDQFQGTLLSNYTEGALFFSLMNEVGYDAIVPGNHDYDFGPAGWLADQVTEESSDKDPRGVIKGLAAIAKFPLLSANTYMKSSLRTIEGKPATVDSVKCATNELIDWSLARRPGFLKPFVVTEVAGIRVALIGLDNPETPRSTTIPNVSDLCFRSSLEEYKSVRASLDGAADVFVVVIHDGDINQDLKLTDLLTGILAWREDGVDAIIGGHTHVVNRVEKNGVFGIQSGANGERFGRIDLVYDRKAGKVVREKTRVAAGAFLFHEICDEGIVPFCGAREGAKIVLEGEKVSESGTAAAKIADAEKAVAPMAKRVLGTTDEAIRKERDRESPLLNLLTDAFREASGADVAMINTGGVRTDLAAGTIHYENLYQVLPFNNRAVMLAPMKVSTLLKVLTRSARSCGKHGSVLGSGIRATYQRGPCKTDNDGLDPAGRVLTMTLHDGTLLYDARDPANPVLNERDLRVATLDFLAAGGSGFDMFKEAPVAGDLGIFRELVAEQLAKNRVPISAKVDGRWLDGTPAPTK
jgi:5'-nucleotidase